MRGPKKILIRTNVYQSTHAFSAETTLRDNHHILLICFDSRVNNVLFLLSSHHQISDNFIRWHQLIATFYSAVKLDVLK